MILYLHISSDHALIFVLMIVNISQRFQSYLADSISQLKFSFSFSGA